MRGMPAENLVFTPDHDDAASVLTKPVRIRLARSRDYFIYDGTYATLYEVHPVDTEGVGLSTPVAFKVFKGTDEETWELAKDEYSILRELDGLDGHHLRRLIQYDDAHHDHPEQEQVEPPCVETVGLHRSLLPSSETAGIGYARHDDNRSKAKIDAESHARYRYLGMAEEADYGTMV